ncbi:anti-sigma factor [Actinoalloteichus hymeniacidonis]|uniref:Regulator of SigK n=1 Tax=Actinoalloteichus hymeniacidonis TaxID=340345 RepID=A0AAC9MYM9_9PSEU|nr:anti-sigma factor [Actinoalloteichus hymeniacidonis]AOS64528.1 hypothetical protein TL08_18670 [Actinoalloteichus hymeniacidonis]MBB5907400.1 anti-sigma-K factor RskA [Actinoalloteichus hymeniacidonis]
MSEQESSGQCPHRPTAVAWALSALDPAEAADFAAHLPTCAECRQAIAETEEIGALLGTAVPQEDPPAGLRSRLLDRVGETEQEVGPATYVAGVGEEAAASDVPPAPADSVAGETERPAGPDSPPPTRPSENPAPPGGRDTRNSRPGGAGRPPRGRRRGRVVNAILVTAVGVLAAVCAGLGIRVVELDRQQDVQARQSESLTMALAMATDPDMHRVTLSDPASRETAMLIAGGGYGAVLPMNLPRNDTDDQMYVLWALQGDEPVAMAGFDVEVDEMPAKPLRWGYDMSEEMSSVTAFAISLEDGRDMPNAPEGEIVASGPMAG